ncbi:hypothetical protein HanXRQr2_Chr01g0016251 [Helianthus annuus]|uniref:Uncharacterized protein n=1 Tax=Helianthus annuus TaxID=4232 RepID=A0A9K3P2H1_HELAN|nr:hypothetical protein HanXRQr2_Chr01g0016251 [Helianthus annuus]KAJ0956505.1 hypothetical protein HanPSC8_Chr01g0015571 [Helianthus annuus]
MLQFREPKELSKTQTLAYRIDQIKKANQVQIKNQAQTSDHSSEGITR